MTDLEKRTNSGESAESLPVLVGRLGEDVLTLLDSKLSLLKIELKEEITAYARGGLAIGAICIAAVSGFILVNVAVAFLASALFARTHYSNAIQYAFGFLITGTPYLILGILFVRKHSTRMSQHRVDNRTKGYDKEDR
jgi:uncharacterized membrane protein YqjE